MQLSMPLITSLIMQPNMPFSLSLRLKRPASHLLKIVLWWGLMGLLTPVIAEESSTVTLKTPPESLRAWYKPQNKRQVWLHTMFRLRRELLAIEDYSQEQPHQTHELLEKWYQGLEKDYLSIETMVPQWKNFLDKQALEQLNNAIAKQQYLQIPKHLEQLKQSCQNCHNDYQAITRLLYRTADFAKIKVQNHQTGRMVSYDKAMEQLSDTVNRIKIAMQDRRYSSALSHIEPLQKGLKSLANGCQDCHKKPEQVVDYIIHRSRPTLEKLKKALEGKDSKLAGRSLGTFAVMTCAKCHSIHRTTAELKELME